MEVEVPTAALQEIVREEVLHQALDLAVDLRLAHRLELQAEASHRALELGSR